MEEPTYSFGEWMRRRRQLLRLRQAELAEHVGCSVITIRKLEADERRPSLQIAERLARALALAAPDQVQFIAAARGSHTTDYLESPEKIAPQRGAIGYAPGNLGVPTTTLLGRSDLLETVRNLLHMPDGRLLTLIGPAGIGKTCLAHQVAYEERSRYADGTWLVRLAPLPHPKLVLTEIAHTLAIDPRGRPVLSALQDYLQARELLLILDNYEHVLDAATVVTQLLEAAPALTIMVTSRAALHIAGERLLPIPALHTDDGVLLFQRQARMVHPAFQIAPLHVQPIQEIVQRLAGIPLAIELAAARVRLFSPAELLTRLTNAGLAELSGGRRDAPARQQTLRAAIAWSYDLLSPTEQRIFRAVAVFAGGWRHCDVAAVCGTFAPDITELPHALEVLLDHHLIVRLPDTQDESCFLMLELIREFAIELLNEVDELAALREQHAQYYLALAEAAAIALNGSQQAETLEMLERINDNLHAALCWCEEQPDRRLLGLRLGTALKNFWLWRGHTAEGVAYLMRLTSQSSEPSAMLGNALNALGWLVAFSSFESAVAIYRHSLAICQASGDKQAIADAYFGLGADTLAFVDLAEALQHLAQAYTLYQELNDPLGQAWTLGYLSRWIFDDIPRSVACGEESLRRFQQLGHAKGRAMVLLFIADRAICCGTYPVSLSAIEEARAIALALGDRLGEGIVVLTIGLYHEKNDHFPPARECYTNAISCFRQVGDVMSAANTLGMLARVCIALDLPQEACVAVRESVLLCRQLKLQPQTINSLIKGVGLLRYLGFVAEAITLLAALSAIKNGQGVSLLDDPYSGYREELSATKPLLPESAYEEAWHKGLELTLERASDFVLDVLPGGTGKLSRLKKFPAKV
jgi:predicted ATPase/transcriptional regulator with XRE-family HTH domain